MQVTGYLWWLSGKESICQEDLSLIPGSGGSPGEGNGNLLQYSCLGNPLDRGPGEVQPMGSQRAGHDLETKQQHVSNYGGKTQEGECKFQFISIFHSCWDKHIIFKTLLVILCDYGFSVPALWCPLATPTVLLGFLLPWTWGVSSGLLQQSAATAPYLYEG